MDKAGYHEKLQKLKELADKKEYSQALQIADDIDWTSIKSLRDLNLAADVYEANHRYEKARDVLKLALDRAAIGRSVLVRLTEVSLKLKDIPAAEEYYQQFVKVSENDNTRYVLQYKILRAKKAPIDDQIEVLETYKDKEYRERWVYELAVLYDRAGEADKCVSTCDDLILWFGEGRYVRKAMDLKLKYAPLTRQQKKVYEEARARKTEKTSGQGSKKKEKSPDQMKRQVAKGIHDVFQGMQDEQPVVRRTGKRKPADGKEKDATVPIEQLHVAELEPESVDSGVIHSPESAKTIVTRPDDSEAELAEAAEQEKAAAKKNRASKTGKPKRVYGITRKAEEEEKKEISRNIDKNLDLDSLLEETAGSFSKEIASGRYGEATIEAVDAAAEPQAAAGGKLTEEERKALKAEARRNAFRSSIYAALDADSKKEKEKEARQTKKAKEETVAAETAHPEKSGAGKQDTGEAQKPGKKPLYNEELEIPDPEPTPEEKLSFSRTIDLNKLGENTIPATLDEVLSGETPEERRIRILNHATPTRMSDEQRKIFTYFARVPGMDNQILQAINGVYEHAGEHTSSHGNIAVMGSKGTGKSRLSQDLVAAMCKDLGMDAAKVARITGSALNRKNIDDVTAKMAGGFLMVENVSEMSADTVKALDQAMDRPTDCMIVIIEDDKAAMRAFLRKYPEFAGKFDKVISIPIFTNDELVTFARTYATESGCQIDDMGVLALYTIIGNNQSFEEPVTISQVKDILDRAIEHARRGSRKFGRRSKNKGKTVILEEKDFVTK